MSAWLCSSRHISKIVNAAEPRELLKSPVDGMSDAEYTFTVLVAENRASLMARYEDDQADEPMQYIRNAAPGSPVETIKLIQSYGYQSCEHEGWETSPARAWTEELKDSQLYKLPGYEAAAWSI